MVTNVDAKFHHDRLHTNKALGNFRKSDKNKKNVRSAWGPFPGTKLYNALHTSFAG